MTNSFSEFSAFQVQINPDAKCMLAHVINTNKVIIVRMPLRNPTRYLGVSGSWGSTKNSKSGKGMKRSHPRPRHPRHPRPSKKQKKMTSKNQISSECSVLEYRVKIHRNRHQHCCFSQGGGSIVILTQSEPQRPWSWKVTVDPSNGSLSKVTSGYSANHSVVDHLASASGKWSITKISSNTIRPPPN